MQHLMPDSSTVAPFPRATDPDSSVSQPNRCVEQESQTEKRQSLRWAKTQAMTSTSIHHLDGEALGHALPFYHHLSLDVPEAIVFGF